MPQTREQESTKDVYWFTLSMVTRYPFKVCVTLTEAITSSLVSPVSAYARNTSRALDCKWTPQGDSVHINSSELIKPRIVTDPVRGIEAKAIKVTSGLATGHVGA